MLENRVFGQAVGGVRTKSWTKLLFLNYVYTEMDSFHPTIF